jgi:hypothetical protein
MAHKREDDSYFRRRPDEKFGAAAPWALHENPVFLRKAADACQPTAFLDDLVAGNVLQRSTWRRNLLNWTKKSLRKARRLVDRRTQRSRQRQTDKLDNLRFKATTECWQSALLRPKALKINWIWAWVQKSSRKREAFSTKFGVNGPREWVWGARKRHVRCI